MDKLNYTGTQLLGIFGHPIKQSFSPLIHNKAIELLDLNYVFLPFNVGTTALPDAIKGVLALGIRGLSITLPHKETILNHLNDLSDEAAMIGSVNTVVNDIGKLIGYNTDVHGFHETLLPYSDKISGQMVTIIGAGGGARAAIYSLIRYFRPSKIVLVNRTEQRAHTLKRYFKQKMKFSHFTTYELFPPDIAGVLADSALIVNATPVGMFPDTGDSVIPIQNSFSKNQIVFDMIYNPSKTQLLKAAQEEGAIGLNGLKMLVYQAAKSFELWTGHEMPVEKITKFLAKEIESERI